MTDQGRVRIWDKDWNCLIDERAHDGDTPSDVIQRAPTEGQLTMCTCGHERDEHTFGECWAEVGTSFYACQNFTERPLIGSQRRTT